MPLGADLGFHLTPSVLLVLDLLLLSPPWSVSVERALGVSGAVAGLYWPWVETCARHNGFYPYPIFEAVGFWGRVGLFGGSAVVMAGCTVGLQWAYGAVNGVLNGGEPREVKGLTESSLPQAVDGLMRQGKYIAKGMKD